MSDSEKMAILEERIRQVAQEHPACRKQLQEAVADIVKIRERLARVEQSHDALEKAVLDMKKDMKEQLSDFKKFVLWTIGAGITMSGIVVSVLQHILGR